MRCYPVWKSPVLGRLLAMLCLLSAGLLSSLTGHAADILLAGAEDSPGMQAFTRR